MHWCVRVQDDLAYPKLIVAPIRFSAMGGVVCTLRSMPCFGAGHFRLILTYFICIVALIRVSMRDAVMLFLYWHRGKATLITSYALFQ